MTTKTVKQTTKVKSKNKPKKSFKMWSAFSILLLIIAVLILVSWILHWAGVSTQLTTNQYFQFINNQWTMIDKLPDSFEGIVEHVNADWWLNTSNTRVESTIYFVSKWTESKQIQALGILDLFVAPIMGFLDKAGPIIFIMVVGAFVYMVIQTKALEASSQMIINKLQGKEIWAIIPLMTIFSIGGTTFGLAEETFGFYMILVPLMIAAGFDTMTGLLIVLLGAGAGVLGSTVNPFTIGVAVSGLNEGYTGTELMNAGDGLVWRVVSCIIFTALAIGFVMWYANRVKKNPTRSVTFETREEDKTFFLANATGKIVMTKRRKATLAVFGISFLFMIIYLIDWDTITNSTFMNDMASWIHLNVPYFNFTVPGFGIGGVEFVAAFFILALIVVGMINGIGVKKEPNQTTETIIIQDFLGGVGDILSVALVIATASGIGYVLRESYLQELIVHGLTGSIGGINSGIGKILILFILFIPLSFLIPSTSGFATAVFPLLTGVVQTSTGSFDPVIASGSITAFSFASGIVNFITPTSGVVMGAMAISRVDYGKFIKLVMPFIGVMFAVSMILLTIGGLIGGNIA